MAKRLLAKSPALYGWDAAKHTVETERDTDLTARTSATVSRVYLDGAFCGYVLTRREGRTTMADYALTERDVRSANLAFGSPSRQDALVALVEAVRRRCPVSGMTGALS
jgi:hypothetical protein